MSFQRRLESRSYNIEYSEDINRDHGLRHDDALSHSGVGPNRFCYSSEGWNLAATTLNIQKTSIEIMAFAMMTLLVIPAKAGISQLQHEIFRRHQ